MFDIHPRRLFRRLALAALLAALPVSVAAEVAAPVIIVVDVQQVMQESRAAQGVQKQLQAQQEIYQKEFAAKEEELRAAEQELGRQRTILAPEAFAQKRKEFEDKVVEVQRGVQTRKKSLDQAFGESMKKVNNEMLRIIADLAKEHGANIVLPKHQVVMVDKSLDLTATVVERLNETLPQVAVNLPKQ